MRHNLLNYGLSAEVIVEVIEAYYRIRNHEAKQTESESTRILEIQKRKYKVKHKICVVEHREHCNGVKIIAEHEYRYGNHYYGKRYSQNKVYCFARFVRIREIETEKIKYLNEGEAYHTGEALLIGQKHEEKVRAHCSDKTELCKDIIALLFHKKQWENTYCANIEISVEREGARYVIHKKCENYFKQ